MKPSFAHRTKIVATLGPACSSPEVIEKLIAAGTDVFRVNFSHGTAEEHERSIARVRDIAAGLGRHIAVLQDLQGVKLRTRPCAEGAFELTAGQEVEIAGGDGPSSVKRIFISPPSALDEVKSGDRILLDDGNIRLVVVRRRDAALACEVKVGGLVKDRRGVNLPDTPAQNLPALTSKDLRDLEVGVRAGVDLVALSFVRSARDVKMAREAIAALGADIPVIAKIEKPQALDDLEDILQQSYGAMVARGDLGVEMDPEKVPVAQKRIISMARRFMKPVITATQMLESMIERPQPTRAEASDVANAVFDGTDAIMLSGETAVGKYPLESVEMAGRILTEAEAELLRQRPQEVLSIAQSSFARATGEAAAIAAESVDARCIIVYTHGGYSAILISGRRPRVPIYVFGKSEPILRRLAVAWGLETRLAPQVPRTVEDLIEIAEGTLLREGLVAPGDPAVIVAGMPFEMTGNTNFLKLHRIGEAVR